MRRVNVALASSASAFLFAILICSPSHIASAQDTEQTGTRQPAKIVTHANTVLVPVVVTDKRGNHLHGLTRDEFEVREDGKLQPILSFEEVTANSKTIEPVKSQPNFFTNQLAEQQAKGLQIITLDLINTSFGHQADSRKAVIDFLSKSVAGKNLVALVVIDRGGVHLVHNFTSDRAVLVSAIQKVQSQLTSRDTHTLNIGNMAKISKTNPIDTGGEDDAEAAQLSAILAGGSSAAEARIDLGRESQDGLLTLKCLQQVAQYFAAVPGRKSLIWVSTGFRMLQSQMSGGFGRGPTPEDWQRTVHALQLADIAVYSVDLGGLLATTRAVTSTPVNNPGSSTDGGVAARSTALQASEMGLTTDPIQAKHDTLNQMAEKTGGQALYNSNDLDDLLRRAMQDSADYYLLAYPASDRQKDGWRKLDVKVHHEGVQVRSRSGFFFTNAASDPDATRQADELMAVTSALEFTSLPITASWDKTEPNGLNRNIHFSILIPAGATEIDFDHENHIFLDFLVLATDLSGKDVGKITQRLDRKLPPAGVTQIRENGITYANLLTLAPGAYSVHIVVRDNMTGRMGSIVAPLKVD